MKYPWCCSFCWPYFPSLPYINNQYISFYTSVWSNFKKCKQLPPRCCRDLTTFTESARSSTQTSSPRTSSCAWMMPSSAGWPWRPPSGRGLGRPLPLAPQVPRARLSVTPKLHFKEGASLPFRQMATLANILLCTIPHYWFIYRGVILHYILQATGWSSNIWDMRRRLH